ncbi:coiled-coil domain-containing protein 108-like [Elysia marginata]|uniref:Coiled-coil domain-containing protein 108-like n=1 Tax=Elysia marginata TaxID=1093978 RepID=A0AAV4F0Y5_9GAST|nr:coiled-coil domain-containing protein 108-like [Elysia marginata]
MYLLPTGLEFNSMEGELPARSKRSLVATVRPVRRIAYSYAISYQLVTPHCPDPPEAAKEPQHLMHLIALGVYPVMTVTDIRSQGSAVGISKKALWGLFSVDNLNAYLDSDPSSEELMYNIATRHSIRKRPSLHTQAILDFNFSAAPVGSAPCTIHIMFENHGTVATDWAFMSPRDIQMEMGYWAESGDCDHDELHDMKVMDNKLFQVTPKKGTLKPFDSTTVTFSYHHTMAGTDRLPVLLKIAGGREIMLNFVGVTVEPEKPYIHFPSSKHVFSPVPVGEKISPTQVYDLYNGGAVPVHYECDLTPLDIIRQENFDQPIFECLNPKGEIPPGRSVSIEWRFFPLEAKTYMVDIPIKVHNGDTAIVTFSGIGYDQRIMGDTMPFSDQLEVSGVPAVQTAEIPGQLGYLSVERVSFGNMPLFCQSRRMVFVTNKSKDRSIFFEWHVTSQTDTQRERQLNEFTITEHDLDADKRIPQLVDITDGRPASRLSKLEALAEGRPVSADGELTKYKTLPPIRQLTEDEKRELDKKKKKKLSQLWQKPEPQKPFLLHLGVTARTHDTKEFQRNFPEEYYHFYIDRTFSDKNMAERAQSQNFVPPTRLHCTLAESNIVASVLGNCLRGLLDDTYFIQAVKKVVQEPIPYFRQFSDKNPSQGANNSPPLSSTPRHPNDMPHPDGEAKSNRFGGQDLEEHQRSRPVTANDVSYEIEGDDAMMHQKHSYVSETMSLPGTPQSIHADQISLEEERVRLVAEASQLKEKQTIKKLPEFGNSVEQVLENTILNLMYEALSSEYSVVSKPRFIAMPRKHLSMSSGLNAPVNTSGTFPRH